MTIPANVRAHVTALHHVGIQVADLDRSLAFYQGLLGFELITRQVRAEPYVGEIVGYPGVELHIAHLQPPGTTTRIELTEYRGVARTPVDTSTANPGTAHTCYVVDDVAAVHAALLAAGVAAVSHRVVEPTAGIALGGKVVYVQDPDGVRVELLQPPSPEGVVVRVEVDQKACAGHGQCSATAPDVYELDDDGFCLPVAAVAAGSEDDAVEGANACPENAITIDGGMA